MKTNRITIKFLHHWQKFIAGDVTGVSPEEAERLIRYGYAIEFKTLEQKIANRLKEVSQSEIETQDIKPKGNKSKKKKTS